MTGMLVTVLLICMSHLIYSKSNLESGDSHDDIVECIFAIKINSSISIRKQELDSKQMVYNIGKTPVQVKTIFSTVTVEPCSERTFSSSMNISNLKSEIHRAIVYVSDCNNDSKVYIEEPEEGYDKNKVLWETATLGVKSIPEDQNLGTLISTFWPEQKENVWQQIYAVIKDLLDDKTKQTISRILNKDIKDIKEEMVALNNIPQNNMNNEDFRIKYEKLINKLKNIETIFKLEDNEIFNLYIIPLYTNVVTMKMYFYALGLIKFKTPDEMFTRICRTVGHQFRDSRDYLSSTSDKAFDKIYDTGYAGGLYNVMMNARSYFTWHAYELIIEWNKVYTKCFGKISKLVQPFSFSNLYGRASPNLLRVGIHINQYTFLHKFSITELNVYIIQSEKQVETVYGLELFLKGDMHSYTSCKGNCTLTDNISSIPLDLNGKTIIKLKVYKTKYIRCLELILSDKKTTRFGNHCEDNSKNSEFYLEGHYISYLYLQNDDPKTGKYFDNVAVQFLPIGLV